MTIHIRPETPADTAAIHEINCQAFGRPDEAHLVDALRRDGDVLLSLVAVRDAQCIGHLLFTRTEIVTDGEVINAASLAPMAVLPASQRQGIGSQLVRSGLDQLARMGERVVIVLGHQHFYPRFGFSAELAKPLQSPFSGEAWMALELVPETLSGVTGTVHYPKAFGLDAM